MITLDSTLQFQSEALQLSSARQQLVASNIANADTPNYQSVDMNFAQALQQAQSGSGSVTLQTTAAGHIATATDAAGAAARSADAVLFSTAPQPSMDGNTVDMDTQRAQFAEATMHYQAAFTFLNGQIKTILSALQG